MPSSDELFFWLCRRWNRSWDEFVHFSSYQNCILFQEWKRTRICQHIHGWMVLTPCVFQSLVSSGPDQQLNLALITKRKTKIKKQRTRILDHFACFFSCNLAGTFQWNESILEGVTQNGRMGLEDESDFDNIGFPYNKFTPFLDKISLEFF